MKGFDILQKIIISATGEQSRLKMEMGRDWKGKITIIFHVSAVCFGLKWPFVAQALYVTAALLWLIPDRRIERSM